MLGEQNTSELEVLIRARYPILYVVSWEEERALGELFRIGDALGKRLYDWTISNGLGRYRPAVDGRMEGRKDTKDPIIALREIISTAEPAIFVLRDFHEFLQNSEVKRRMRDIAAVLRSSLATVVILSPILRLPDELEKDITIVDFPLPDRDELKKLLRQIESDISGNPRLSMDMSEDSVNGMVDAAVGLTLNEAENVFAKTLVSAQKLSLAEVPLIYSEKKQVIRKSGLLEYINTDEDLKAVGGLDELKAWVGRRRSALDTHAIEFGLPAPRGVLLVGVQGCGKSLAAKSMANELGYPLVRLDIGRLFSKMVGETESNIRRALSIAEALAPIVLWIDEIEKGLSGSGSSDSTDGGTTARLFATILTWLQEKTSPVFVVATANDIEKLPPEVLRKGRFDEIFFVDLPSEKERKIIFEIHLKKRGRDISHYDTELLAKLSEGYSGAEIEQIVVEALFSVYGVKADIETADLVGAVKSMIPLSRSMRRSINDRRMWALGRTINASSGGETRMRLDAPDAVDAEKEAVYVEYLNLISNLNPIKISLVERYLGQFPPKTTDSDLMRAYVGNFKRLYGKLDGSMTGSSNGITL